MVALVVVALIMVIFSVRTLCPSNVLITFCLLGEKFLIFFFKVPFLIIVIAGPFLPFFLIRAACGREVS
jgi:hypothetical protein